MPSVLALITLLFVAQVLVVAAAAAEVEADVAATSSSMSRTITTKGKARMTKAADAEEDVDVAAGGKAGTAGSGEKTQERIRVILNVNMHGIGRRAAGRKTRIIRQALTMLIPMLVMKMATHSAKVCIRVGTVIIQIVGTFKMHANFRMQLLLLAVYACVLFAGVFSFSGVDVYVFVLGVPELVVYRRAILLLTILNV